MFQLAFWGLAANKAGHRHKMKLSSSPMSGIGRHPTLAIQCPLSGVRRTSLLGASF
jgi:hypothetical protein